MPFLEHGTKQTQEAMGSLYANAEQNLALAKHAETWEWKETDTVLSRP